MRQPQFVQANGRGNQVNHHFLTPRELPMAFVAPPDPIPPVTSFGDTRGSLQLGTANPS